MAMRDLALFRPSLYFINCGNSQAPENLIYAGGDAGRQVDLVWGFFVMNMDGRTILIDSGFSDPAKAAEFGVTLIDPLPVLRSLAIEPRMVTDIVITHHHFDHTGNIPKFPHARVIIQRQEYELYRKEYPAHPEVPSSQLRRFDDEYDLDSMLQIRKIGGHSPGSSEVTFLYKGKTYLIPGDECYMYDNFRKQQPVGLAVAADINRDYVAALPGDKVVLPFHDPEILKKYQDFGDGVVRILPEQ